MKRNSTKITKKEILVNPSKIMAWQLRRAGHTAVQVAMFLGVSVGTIKRWDFEIKAQLDDELSQMPDIKAASDKLKLLIPKAVNAYEKLVKTADRDSTKLAAANAILKNFKVIEDVESGTDKQRTDDELTGELVSILKTVVERQSENKTDSPREEKT